MRDSLDDIIDAAAGHPMTMVSAMKFGTTNDFARRVFTAALIWGLISLAPMYFMESVIAAATGDRVSPPEYYYGFVGTALAFQGVFYWIAWDPARYRKLMLVGIVEKAGFVLPALILYIQGRSQVSIMPFAVIDACFAALFLAAYVKTRPPA